MAITRVEFIETGRNVFDPLTYEASSFDVTEALLHEIDIANVNPIAVDVVTENGRNNCPKDVPRDVIPEGYYYTAGISPNSNNNVYWTTFPHIYKTPDEARCAVYMKWKYSYLKRVRACGKDFVDKIRIKEQRK